MTQQAAKAFAAPPSPAAAGHASAHASVPARTVRIRLWDLPVRIFHWSLALLVLAAFVTANVGGPWMAWHGRAGIAIAGLVAFRFVWGVVGSTHARFATFAPTPSRLRAYLTGKWQGVGHNPLGALSVFALLALLAAQVVTGLLGNDDIDFNGPLSSLVAKERSDSLTGLHHQLSNVLLVLIGLHIAAILFYILVKRTNLVGPMLTGWKEARVAHPVRSGSVVGLVVALLAALGAMLGASGELLHESIPAPAAQLAAPASGPGGATAAPAPATTPSW
jgi:cytochrome b